MKTSSIKLLALILATSSLWGCSVKVAASNTTNNNAAASSGTTILNGRNFATICSVQAGADQISSMSINADGSISALTMTSYESSDGSCTTQANVVVIVQTPIVFGSVAAGTGQTTVNSTFSTGTLIPSSAGMAAVFNGLNSGAGLCNINTWASGVSQDVASCFGWAPGTVTYGTLWITGSPGSYVVTQDSAGDTVGCGANNNTSAMLRCTTPSVDPGYIFYEY